MKSRLFDVPEPAESSVIGTAFASNLFPQINHAGDLCWVSRPGIVAVTNAPALPQLKLRGWKVVEDKLYAVIGRNFLRFSTDFSVETLGTLQANQGYLANEPVTIESNMFSLALADGYAGYSYDLSEETFSTITDFPGGYSMAFLKGFLLTEGKGPNHGFIYQSAVYDSTSWNALEYGSAEDRPDNALRVYVQNDIAYIFGTLSIECWYASGTSGFAFAPLPGAALNYGVAALQSIVPFRGQLTALLKSGGDLLLASLDGYTLVPLSRTQSRSSALESEWASYPTVVDAVACSYTIAGHSIYQISFPSAADGIGVTWALDGATSIWFRLSSGVDDARFRGDNAIAFNGQILMTDYDTNQIFALDKTVFTDLGADVVFELRSNSIKDEGHYHTLTRLWLDFEVGQTKELEEGGLTYDPVVRVSLSPDGGETYKPERLAYLGRQGEWRTRVIQRRWGRALNSVVRIQGSYPVNFVLAGAGVELG